MNSKQINKLNMYLTVKAVLTDHAADYHKVTAFVDSRGRRGMGLSP
jgi:hypothetical protein